MKLVNAAQLRALDAYTIEQESIESIDLIERASIAFSRWFTERYRKDQKVIIFCGIGNNGADGLAIARLLLQKMFLVEIYSIGGADPVTNFEVNEERLSHLAIVQRIKTAANIPSIPEDIVVIDALLGSGISRKVEGLLADVILTINSSNATIVSVDIPSGLYLDKQNEDSVIVHADYTVTFQLPKLAFMFPQHYLYVGEWFMVHIGLSKEYIDKITATEFFLDESFVKSIVRKRKKFSHKGDYGKALVLAGNFGMLGAAVLMAKACLRSGVGLLKVYVPESGFFVLQNDIPEAIVIPDLHPEFISDIPPLEEFTAIGVGPGIGTKKETLKAFEKLLASSKVPLVVDADALNLLSEHKHLLVKLPAGSILCPHVKEFERLAGPSDNEYHRLEKAKAFSTQFAVHLILKGAHSAVVCPDGLVYFNSTGNPGMATAGAGDVLAGILTSLLAQGYTSKEAAILGTFIHGYAGDSAARRLSQESMLASDIIEGITTFFKDFSK